MAERVVTHARVTTKLRTYLVLAVMGAFLGLTFGRPAFIAVTAPLAVYAALGVLAGRRVAELWAQPIAHPPVREGAPVEARLRIAASVTIGAQLQLTPGRGLRARTDRRGRPLRVTAQLRAGEWQELAFELTAQRWGAPRAGSLTGVLRDRFGMIEHELVATALPAVRVLPEAETLRRLLDPHELQATVGSRVARERGEGIELAEVRAFHPGDAVRRINWQVSARRGTLHVTDRHPERNADVILFLDTFSDIGGTLGFAVRAAATLAAGYLERRDRVGVIGFGGVLAGVGPRLGTRQLYRIVDTLLASSAEASYANKDVRLVPRRLLPPKALVVALSPLVDERSITALLDLRRRGHDLAIVELSPEPFLPPPSGAEQQLARRLWHVRREAVRGRLRARGATVQTWDGAAPLQLPVGALAQLRTRTRGRVGA
jgi:uncharacterized protein (DUF58 family)